MAIITYSIHVGKAEAGWGGPVLLFAACKIIVGIMFSPSSQNGFSLGGVA
jgi:hypothetical protein